MKIKTVRRAAWARDVLYRSARRKILYGGRGAGKTYEVGQALAILAAAGEDNYFGRPLRILLAREKQKSIRESSLAEIGAAIDRIGLPGFKKYKMEIAHENGSLFMTAGLSTVTEESLKSMHGVDVAWVEEAHKISQMSMDLLEPTIRKPDSEIIYTMNIRNRGDAVAKKYVYGSHEFIEQEGAVVRKVLLNDNAAPPEMLEELYRQANIMKIHEPNKYKHIWLGEPDDVGGGRKMLRYADLRKCLKKRIPQGYVYAGYDPAAGGSDYNSVVIRQGPCIIYHERWRGESNLNNSVRRVARLCRDHGVYKLFFDETGLGAGVGSTLADMHVAFEFEGIQFGSKPSYPKEPWGFQGLKTVLNEDRYAYRTAQLGDAMRNRLQASLALLRGEVRVTQEECLWIDPDIKDLEMLLIDLDQPEEKETMGGKMAVDKQPKSEGSSTKPPSPDSYDAAILSFATDSNFGLKRLKWLA